MPAFSLLLPGILDVDSARMRALFEGSPRLRSLLAAAVSSEQVAGDTWTWVCESLRIPRQSDWPLASIWAAADGLDVGEDYWLVAAPVVLEVGRVDVRLISASPIMDESETVALLDALNAHFADDGLRFVRGCSGRWFACQPAPARMTTHAPEATAARSLREFLPQGPDAGRWRRWQNEIQMLMHAERERRAELDSPGAANAIWFWGGGTLPPRHTALDVSLASDDTDVIALAAHAGATSSALREFDPYAGRGKNIALLWNANGPIPAGDAGHALTALNGHPPRDADLVLTGHNGSIVVHSRRGSMWQRWRRRFGHADTATLMAAAKITGAEES